MLVAHFICLSFADEATVAIADSTNDGLSWGGFAPVLALPDPGCKGGIAAWPAKKALLFTNDATTHGRVNVTLRVSTGEWAAAVAV